MWPSSSMPRGVPIASKYDGREGGREEGMMMPNLSQIFHQALYELNTCIQSSSPSLRLSLLQTRRPLLGHGRRMARRANPGHPLPPRRPVRLRARRLRHGYLCVYGCHPLSYHTVLGLWALLPAEYLVVFIEFINLFPFVCPEGRCGESSFL